jgi:hypothetical protein
MAKSNGNGNGNGNGTAKANAPVHEVRLGAIKAAIWLNDTKNGARHSVKITRLYKDGEEWRTTDTFGRDDLPLVEKVAALAHAWIFSSTQRQTAAANMEDDND